MSDNFKDPVWRLNHLYKIQTKDARMVTFKENKHQAKVNRSKTLRKQILKARQVGISTACILRMFDETIWTPNTTSMIMAHEQDSIKKLFRIVMRAHKFMHPDIQPKLDRGGGSKYEYYFPEINSRIYCDLESRSDTIQNLHVSEYGLMDDDERVLATLDAVPRETGKVTIESTPKGLNHFYDSWMNPETIYEKHFIPWFHIDEYQIPTKPLDLTDEEKELVVETLTRYGHTLTHEQLAFRRWKIQDKGGGSKGAMKFLEEYPSDDLSCFLTSGDAVFDLHHIQELIREAPKPLRDTGDVRIYKHHDKSKTYVAGADTAEGVGGDFSVGVLVEVQSRQVAAVLRGQFKPSEFAEKLNELCLSYKAPSKGPPLLAVEKNNHGHAVLQWLNETLFYPNLYYRKLPGGDNDKTPGWVTDRITRPVMLDDFIHAVEEKYLQLFDKHILAECLTLVNNDGKIEASTGKHDDCIIAASLANQMLKVAGNLSVYEDLTDKILL